MSTHGMKARLARELGISGAAVSKLAKQGMPADDADAARRWRAAHLSKARMRPDPGPSEDTLLRRAQSLVDLASDALKHHQFGLVAGELRAAMRALPQAHRGRLALPFDLVRALLGEDAMRRLDALPKDPPATASEAELEFVGQVLYMVASGEASL